MLELSEGEDVEATGGVLWAGEVFGFEANVDACGEGGEDLKVNFGEMQSLPTIYENSKVPNLVVGTTVRCFNDYRASYSGKCRI